VERPAEALADSKTFVSGERAAAVAQAMKRGLVETV
jgi:hypothetical protein